MARFAFHHRWLRLVACVCALGLAQCGELEEPASDTDADSSNTISIQNFAFIPTTITVPAGGEVFFLNLDEVPHRILSQSDNDMFDNTGEFDSLIIPAGEIGVISISSTAASGTQIPFYDDVVQEAMATPNGVITVE